MSRGGAAVEVAQQKAAEWNRAAERAVFAAAEAVAAGLLALVRMGGAMVEAAVAWQDRPRGASRNCRKTDRQGQAGCRSGRRTWVLQPFWLSFFRGVPHWVQNDALGFVRAPQAVQKDEEAGWARGISGPAGGVG